MNPRIRSRSPLADALEAGGMKRCRRCEEEKPLAAFNVDARNRDGRMSYCRSCHGRSSAEDYAMNRARRAGTYYASPNALPVCGDCGHAQAGSHGVPDPVRAGRLLWLCEPCYTRNRIALDAIT